MATLIEKAAAKGWTVKAGTLQAKGLWHAFRKDIKTSDDVTVWCESANDAAKEALKMQREQDEAKKSKLYHSLLENIDGRWTIQFGDYDKAVVRQEMLDQKAAAEYKRKGENFKIIVTGNSKAEIEADVAKLNAAKG